MKNLARHIEWLLHDNDCVILPGFGGFIAHVVPAYYVSNDQLYYPPSRSISFNTAITMNDGLLIQSYMRTYNVDYAQATYLVDMAIERLRDALDEEGVVTIPHIGVLKQDIHQSILFEAEPSGVSSPLHFGLGAFGIRSLAQLQAQPKKDAQQTKSIITQTDRTIEVRIQKRTLQHFLSTAAVFLLLLMIALPIGDLKPTDVAALRLTDIIYSKKSEIIPVDMLLTDSIIEEVKDSVQIENEEKKTEVTETMAPSFEEQPLTQAIETPHASTTLSENTATNALTIENSIHSDVVETIQPISDGKIYHIIVASLPSHRGAEAAIASYVSKGYTQTSIVERDNRVRISLANFTDKNEANSYLKTLRENEAFQNAWLLPVQN